MSASISSPNSLVTGLQRSVIFIKMAQKKKDCISLEPINIHRLHCFVLFFLTFVPFRILFSYIDFFEF